MRMVGPLLFIHAPLDEVLRTHFENMVRDAVYDVCVETTRVSKLRLKRAIIEAAQFTRRVELGTPGPITTRQVTAYGNVEASCSVPFTGDPQLLQLSAPAWPRVHAVRGQVADQVIRLDAEAGGQFVTWPPTLFAAEIEAIDQHLAAQSELVRRYGLDLEPQVQDWVNYIQPRLNPVRMRNVAQSPLVPVLMKSFRQSAWNELVNAPSEEDEVGQRC